MQIVFNEFEKKCLNDFIDSVTTTCIDIDFCNEKCPAYIENCTSTDCLLALLNDKLSKGGD